MAPPRQAWDIHRERLPFKCKQRDEVGPGGVCTEGRIADVWPDTQEGHHCVHKQREYNGFHGQGVHPDDDGYHCPELSPLRGGAYRGAMDVRSTAVSWFQRAIW